MSENEKHKKARPVETDMHNMLLPKQSNRAVQAMLDVIEELASFYEQENETVDATDTRSFITLQDRKIALARRYQEYAKQALARRDELKNAAPDLRQRLIIAHDKLTEHTSKNLDGLERLRKGVNRLSERIMSGAREAAQKEVPNYNAGGSLTPHKRAVSMGLNESA